MPMWRHTAETICDLLAEEYGCTIGEPHKDDAADEEGGHYYVVKRGETSAFLFVYGFDMLPSALMHLLNRLGIDFEEVQKKLDAKDADVPEM